MPSAGGAPAEEVLARALQVIEQQSARIRCQSAEIRELREQNAQVLRASEELRELVGGQATRLAEANSVIAVLQRMVSGRSSEKSGPAPDGGGGDDAEAGAGDGGKPGSEQKEQVKRGPGARPGRRGYPGLPRFEVFWDFPGGGYRCPDCGEPFSLLGDHWSGEQLDWQVIIRLVANCRRRYKRECRCEGPATVMAPGPPEAIGKGLFTNGFTAMLLVERFEAGRSANSLVTGLARQGAEISPATLAGTVAQAGTLLAPLEDAIAGVPVPGSATCICIPLMSSCWCRTPGRAGNPIHRSRTRSSYLPEGDLDRADHQDGAVISDYFYRYSLIYGPADPAAVDAGGRDVPR